MTTDNEIKGILHVPEGSVVVGIDGADPSNAALMWAAAEAARRDLELHIVNVEETLAAWLPLGAAVGEVTQTLDASSTALVKQAMETVSERYPKLAVSSSQPEGQPSRNFVKASETAALLVLGTHGHHKFSHAALGTTAFKTASHAACPVVLVHPERKHEHVSPARVVVGVDFSPSSQQAVDFAALAAGPGGTVRVVHAWWLSSNEGAILGSGDTDAERTIIEGHAHDVDDIVAQARTRHPEVTFEALPMQGSPMAVLTAAADEADLLVVSKRGRGGFGGLLVGSTAYKMMAASPVPVALTHPSTKD
jgi:nucleotide-binding universal stress UspA family protein